MPQARVLVLRAPGTNCDEESAFAFERAGAKANRLHVNRLLENPALFQGFQILCLPGGFSYGDDLGAGRILGSQMQHHLADQLAQFKDDGKLILGICNGFQVLLKTRVLLDVVPQQGPAATLALNDSGRYEDRWVRLGADATKCVFLKGIQQLYLPVAHAEGKFVVRDAALLDWLRAAGQLALRYLPQDCQAAARRTNAPLGTEVPSLGRSHLPFPDNPNGSMGDAAGVCDATGRVLGLMPHPERYIDRAQHPRWTRGEGGPTGDGLALFVNAVQYFA